MPVPPGHDELRDVRLAQAGDTRAFERLYRIHLPHVHRTATWLLGTNEVDDVVQDVFVRVWHRLGTFNQRSALRTWLHRVAVNVILRRRQRMAKIRDSVDAELPELAGYTADPGLTMDMEAAVTGLPDRPRMVFVLHQIQGCSHREIAELMGMTVATSRTQLHRARTLLRNQLKGEYS